MVETSYGAFAERTAELGVRLVATVGSEILDVAEHHARFTERRRPALEGYYFYDSDPDGNAVMNFVPGPLILDKPYSAESPVKLMVVVDVAGVVDSKEVSYQAFLLQYQDADGGCSVMLLDPVVPGVAEFVSDGAVAEVFPECVGPRESRRRMLLEAMPGFEVTGYDERTQTFDGHHLVAIDDTPIASGGGECVDFDDGSRKGGSVSVICADAFAGYGNWVRGGSWSQSVDCAPVDGKCTIQTQQVSDDLHSSIRSGGWFECDCCDEYGAQVSGGKNSANLISQANGTTGGHVAIAKSIEAHRTSSGTSRSELQLKGDCKGSLDKPAHGATGTGDASLDYKSESSQVMNQAMVGVWNADSVVVHLCLPAR